MDENPYKAPANEEPRPRAKWKLAPIAIVTLFGWNGFYLMMFLFAWFQLQTRNSRVPVADDPEPILPLFVICPIAMVVGTLIVICMEGTWKNRPLPKIPAPR